MYYILSFANVLFIQRTSIAIGVIVMKLETTLGIGSKEKDLEIQSLEILKTSHSQLEIQIHQKQIADSFLYLVLTLIKLIALHIHTKLKQF